MGERPYCDDHKRISDAVERHETNIKDLSQRQEKHSNEGQHIYRREWETAESAQNKELSIMNQRLDAHRERLDEVETERRVERAALSKTDRLLIIIIPPLGALGAVLLGKYLGQ